MILRKNLPEVAFIKFLYREYKVKHKINWTAKTSTSFYLGMANMRKNLITINTYQPYKLVAQLNGYDKLLKRRITVEEFLSTAFHELQHFIMYRRGAFTTFHKGIQLNASSIQFNQWKREYLKAERMADKLATKMMKKYYPHMIYKANYLSKDGKEYVRQHIEAIEKLRLK